MGVYIILVEQTEYGIPCQDNVTLQTQKLKEADSEPWCGMQVIDINTGSCVHWFRIDGAVAEMYDVDVVPGVVCAQSLGFATNQPLGLITIE